MSLRRARELLTGPRLASLDQVVVSAGNFATTVVVARGLDAQEFGLFAFASFVFLSALAIQYGLLLQPMLIEGGALDDDQFKPFLRAQAVLQAGYVATSAIVLVGLTLLWEPLRPLVVPFTVAGITLEAQDFLRRALYARRRVGGALLSNAVGYDLQAVVLLALAWPGGLDLARALWTMAGTSMLAILVAAVQLQWFGSAGSVSLVDVLRRTWQLGRWALTTSILQELAAQALLGLVTTRGGLVGTAGYGVVSQLLGPAYMLTRPLGNYHLALAAQVFRTEGEGALRRVVRGAARAISPPYLVYLSCLAIGAPLILGAAYGERYAEHADALRVFVLAVGLRLPIYVFQLELHTRRLQSQLVFAESANLAALVVSGPWLIQTYGLIGAGLAAVLASGAHAATVVLLVIRARRVADATPAGSDRAP
jgi:O-antigen/teichoic acid export membrane protein